MITNLNEEINNLKKNKLFLENNVINESSE